MKKAIKQSTMELILNTLTVLALIAVIGFFVWYAAISAWQEEAAADRYRLVDGANTFVGASNYLTNEFRAYSVTGNEERYENYWHEVDIAQNREKSIEEMKAIGIDQMESEMLEGMLTISNYLIPFEEQAMQYAKRGDTSSAVAIAYGEFYESNIQQIRVLQNNFIDKLEERTGNTLEQLMQTKNTAMILMIFCLMAAAVTQIINVMFVHLKVIVPLKELKEEMENIAAGRLHGDFTIETDTSEIGMLSYAMQQTKISLQTYIGDISNNLTAVSNGDMTVQTMGYIGDFSPIQQALTKIVDSLNEVLGEFDAAADQIATGSLELSTGSQALSQGTAEQASAIVQLSATIEDISKQTANTAQTAVQTSRKADEVGAKINDSDDKMQQMLQAMAQINDTSTEIEKVVKAISDIAFQTNILSLNAAVEAARAGAAGKGFAVVADEVQNLASKSAEAVKDTTQLMAKNAVAVEKGAAMAKETADSLRSVVALVTDVVQAMDDVSHAASIQSEAILQFNQGMEQISNVVQTNSSTAEQSAAASEQLSGQAAMLKGLVGQFRLRHRTRKPLFDIGASQQQRSVSYSREPVQSSGLSQSGMAVSSLDIENLYAEMESKYH